MAEEMDCGPAAALEELRGKLDTGKASGSSSSHDNKQVSEDHYNTRPPNVQEVANQTVSTTTDLSSSESGHPAKGHQAMNDSSGTIGISIQNTGSSWRESRIVSLLGGRGGFTRAQEKEQKRDHVRSLTVDQLVEIIDQKAAAQVKINDLTLQIGAMEMEKKTANINLRSLRIQKSTLETRNANLLSDIEDLRKQVKRWKSLHDTLKVQSDRLAEDHKKLRVTADNLKDELKEERDLVGALQQNIRDQEKVVTEAHTTAITLLARDVSAEFPDDQIKEQLGKFSKDLFDWCVDARATGFDKPDDAKTFLQNQGILRRDNDGLAEHLRFDITSNTASAFLLPAALSHELCRKMLDDPFFLASGLDASRSKTEEQHGSHPKSWPQSLLEQASKLPESETIMWRIQTCKVLEQAFPPKREVFQTMADDFVRKYRFLLCHDLDDYFLHELVSIFQTFGLLALRLMKLKTRITVQSLGDASYGLADFRVMHGEMEAHSAVKLLAGDRRLDGRPVCVVVWPRIVSEPIDERNTGRNGGGARNSVLWSNAVVWVSDREAKRRMTDYIPSMPSVPGMSWQRDDTGNAKGGEDGMEWENWQG